MYDLSFDLLKEPSDYYQVREGEVKEWFVQYLVSMLKEEETDHEELTDPLLVIASCSVNEFKAVNRHNNTYDVKWFSKLLMSNIHYKHNINRRSTALTCHKEY